MTSDQFGSFVKRRYQHLKPNCRRRNPLFVVYGIYTVSQKKLGHFFTAYNFRNIEQIFTTFGTNQRLFILNIVPEFI